MIQIYICAKLADYCYIIPVTPAFLHVLSVYFRWFRPLMGVDCCVLATLATLEWQYNKIIM